MSGSMCESKIMFYIVICSILSLCSFATSADIEQEWTISYATVRPDGFPKVVPVVNGIYPGPTIRGHTGQSVRIVVHNALITETTSIHWHGVKQTGTVWSDGMYHTDSFVYHDMISSTHLRFLISNMIPPELK